MENSWKRHYHNSIVLIRQQTKSLQITSCVPQGYVLGPTLWIILYEDMFDMEMPEGTTLVGFADDVAILIIARIEELLMNLDNGSLHVTPVGSAKLKFGAR